MTAANLIDAIIKWHNKMPSWMVNVVDGAVDSFMDDIYGIIEDVSPFANYIFYEMVNKKAADRSVSGIVNTIWEAQREVAKILKDMQKIEDGDRIDTEELDKQAEEEGWTDDAKYQYVNDEIAFAADDYWENLKTEYDKEIVDAFQKDKNMNWSYAYELPRIATRIEQELDKYINDNTMEEAAQDAWNNSVEYDEEMINWGEPIKQQILRVSFEE